MNRRSVVAALAGLPFVGKALAATPKTVPDVVDVWRGHLSHEVVTDVTGIQRFDMVGFGVGGAEFGVVIGIDAKTKTLTVMRDYGRVL